jgi:uncharacterized protein
MERMRTEALDALLTDDQKRVMALVLDQEGARREHLVVYLSGAHAYGFPSPDSDLDLKAIHIARTEDLLGFDIPQPTADRAEIIESVEIDYTSNELGHALAGILAGNGNFIERVLGCTVVQHSALLGDLRPLVQRSLSRRVHRHYRGFALNQIRFLEREPSAKKLLYVLRTALTGIHVLETRELDPDLTHLMDKYGYSDAAELVARKRSGERVALDPALLDAWRPRIEKLMADLDRARDQSPLPEEPTNEGQLRDWLMAARRARFGTAASPEGYIP